MSASLAISHSGSETRVEFFLDGAALHAESGMTIAAAIEAGGRHDFSRGLKGRRAVSSAAWARVTIASSRLTARSASAPA